MHTPAMDDRFTRNRIGAALGVFLAFFIMAAALARAAESKGWLLVANKGDKTMGIIDPSSGKQIAAIPEDGDTGHELSPRPTASGRSSQSSATRAWAKPEPMAASSG